MENDDLKQTMQDYLNEDCLRAVLVYVPLKDIICSERVSRQWQRMVHVYLRGVRIGIERPYIRVSETLHNVCPLTLWEAKFPSFNRWTDKLGPSVVATYCTSEECLKTITRNCPNLEAVTFLGLHEEQLLNIQIENFKFLKRIRFLTCHISDQFITNFIGKRAVEELEIGLYYTVAGECLLNIDLSSLKSLLFHGCDALHSRHLLAAADRLGGLTRLVLKAVPEHIYWTLHLLLDKLPNLEHLHISGIRRKSECLFQSVCRLGKLKHFTVSVVASDEDIEAVTKNCTELRSLQLMACDDVSAWGVLAACGHAGGRLTALAVHRSHRLDDDAVLAVIHQCPKLTSLDLEGCFGLSAGLAVGAAAARRRLGVSAPLRLRVSGTDVKPGDPDQLARIILDFSEE